MECLCHYFIGLLCAIHWSRVYSGVGFIASMLIAGPISLSLALIFLRITRGEEVKVEMIFEGFYDFTRSFVTVLLTTLYILLWCCC
jgi:uncharacterized membrane protein